VGGTDVLDKDCSPLRVAIIRLLLGLIGSGCSGLGIAFVSKSIRLHRDRTSILQSLALSDLVVGCVTVVDTNNKIGVLLS